MMIWLTRLLPTGRGLRRRASNDDHGRILGREGRRRTITLERLESRMVLSDVTVTQAGSVAMIVGDNFNDSFSVTESAGGKVMVTPTLPTTVNHTGVTWTLSKVTSIVINLPGGKPGTLNSDSVTLLGPGKTTPTGIGNVTITPTGANLTFTAYGVDNTGSLTLSDTAGNAPGIAAALSAVVQNSTFSGGMSLAQTGTGTATIELDNVNTVVGSTAGPVTVSEGLGNKDSFILDNTTGAFPVAPLPVDTFGVTKLSQGAGPSFGGTNGTGDSVVVNNASVTSLAVSQYVYSPFFTSGNGGAKNSIIIDILSVAQNNFGVTTAQANGAGDTTTITGVTASSPTSPIPVTPSIVVTQGSGAGDSASVAGSSLPGSISITQSDQAGSPGDSATISGDTVGYSVKSGSQVVQAFASNLSISQGDASVDVATISNSSAVGDVSIAQGNGGGAVVNNVPQAGDQATISGVTSGIVLEVFPFFDGGNITITQGSGSGDSASVSNSTAVNNVSIMQADSFTGNPLADTATITGVTAGVATPAIFGNIVIIQGNPKSDTATVTLSTAVGGITIL